MSILVVILVIATQAVSPLYSNAITPQHKEEMPNDNNSENEIKELQELEVEELLYDTISEGHITKLKNTSQAKAYNLIQQFHRVLPVPPPEHK